MTTEISDRKDAITAADDKITKVRQLSGLQDNGNYKKDNDAEYISDADTLAEADNLLDAQFKTNADAISSEIGNRADAISALNDKINTVTDDRTSGGAALNDRVDHLLDVIDCGML